MVRTFSGSISLFYQRIARKIFPGINYCFKTDLLLSQKTLMMLTFSGLISLFYQRIARKIFLELTQISDGSDTRRRVKLGDLVNKYYTLKSFQPVIKSLVDERLIVTMGDKKEENSSTPIISIILREINPLAGVILLRKFSRLTTDESTMLDVIHEALIRHWLQLQKWKEEYQNYKDEKGKKINLMVIERYLEKQAQQWQNYDKSPRFLLNPGGLDIANIYKEGTEKLDYKGMLNGLAEEFIKKSQKAEQQRQEKDAQDKLRLEEMNRKLRHEKRWLLRATSVVIFFIMIIALWAAYWNQEQKLRSMGVAATALSKVPGKEIEDLVMAIQSYGKGIKKIWFDLNRDESINATIATVSAFKSSLPLEVDQDTVNLAKLSPDGNHVVTISEDYKAILWNAENGKLIQKLKGETNEFIEFAQFSPDGKQIITTGNIREVKKEETRTPPKIIKGVVRLWNTETGTLTKTLEVGEKYIKKVIFDRQGQRIAIIENRGTIQIRDLTTKQLINTIPTELRGELFVQFSPDGKLLLVADSQTKEIQKWDIETGNKISSKIIAQADPNSSNRYEQLDIKDLWWNGNNLRVVVVATSSPYNVKAILWDENNQKSIPLRGHTPPITDAHFSKDGTRLVTASEDSTARIWNTETGELISILRAHTYGVYFAGFSPDGKKVVTIDRNDTVRIWNIFGDVQPLNYFQAERRKVLDEYGIDEYKLFFPTLVISPDEKTLLITTNQRSGGRLWDANTGERIKEKDSDKSIILKIPGYINSAQFSPTGNHIAILSRSDQMYLGLWKWDGTSLERQTLLPPQGEKLSLNVSKIHQGFGSLVFSHKGDRLAICTDDGKVSLWSVSQAQLIKETKINVENRFPSSGCQIDFSPDDQLILTVIGSTITIWDTNTDQQSNFPIKENIKERTSAQFSPDGKWLVTLQRSDLIATIWDVEQKKIHQELTGDKHGLDSAVFSPDSRYVVTASEDQKAGVWEVKTGKFMFWLEGHLDWVDSAIFSPDGSQILTASRDGTARLWNAKTGNVLGVFGAMIGRNSNDVPVPLASAQFFDDGKKFLTMDKDGVVRIYSAEPKTYVTEACQLLKHRSVYPEVEQQCERLSKQ